MTIWSGHCLCRLAAKFPYAKVSLCHSNWRRQQYIRRLLEARWNSLKNAAIEDEVVNNFERRSTDYNVSWNILQRTATNLSQKLHPGKRTRRLHLEIGILGRARLLSDEKCTFGGAQTTFFRYWLPNRGIKQIINHFSINWKLWSYEGRMLSVLRTGPS